MPIPPPRRRLRRTLTTRGAAALLAVAVCAPVGAASAKPPDYSWHPYRADDLTYTAGERCAFKVTGTVVKDGEEYRTVNFWPNGTPRTQQFRGPLVIRWKNVATGRSVVRDQSGRAYAGYDRQGNLLTLTALSGHFGAGMPAGSTPFKGIAYLGGRWTSVSINADGTVTAALGPDGTIENLCRTLSK